MATDRARVVTVAQQKGGAGKTTLVLQIAVALHDADPKAAVCVVDIDPQGSLSRWFELRQRRRDESDRLVLVKAGGWRLPMELARLREQFDWILVDTPPHAETDTRVALREADLVLVPCQPSLLDVWASRPTLEAAAKEGRRARIVLNRVPTRGRALDEAKAALAEAGAEPVDATLGGRQAFVTCLGQGQGVVESEPRSVAAQETRALVESIRALCRKRS